MDFTPKQNLLCSCARPLPPLRNCRWPPTMPVATDHEEAEAAGLLAQPEDAAAAPSEPEEWSTGHLDAPAAAAKPFDTCCNGAFVRAGWHPRCHRSSSVAQHYTRACFPGSSSVATADEVAH